MTTMTKQSNPFVHILHVQIQTTCNFSQYWDFIKDLHHATVSCKSVQ